MLLCRTVCEFVNARTGTAFGCGASEKTNHANVASGEIDQDPRDEERRHAPLPTRGKGFGSARNLFQAPNAATYSDPGAILRLLALV